MRHDIPRSPGGAVKPGDLAIVCSPSNPNHERIVDVVDFAPSMRFRMPCGHYMRINPNHGIVFVCKGVGGPMHDKKVDGGFEPCVWVAFAATSLRPLPGDDVPESEWHAEEVGA